MVGKAVLVQPAGIYAATLMLVPLLIVILIIIKSQT